MPDSGGGLWYLGRRGTPSRRSSLRMVAVLQPAMAAISVLVTAVPLRNDASGRRDLPHPPQGDLASYARPKLTAAEGLS
jgi:hypothetical protein